MRNSFLTGLLLSSLIMPALAQSELPEQLDLDTFLSLVDHHNYGLRAERMQIDAARGELISARALPNPNISYTKQGSEEEYMLEQELPIFGQRGIRVQRARSELAAAHAHTRETAAEKLQDAAHRFTALFIAQEREKRQLALYQQLQRAAHIVNGQHEAGVRSEYDQLRMSIELAAMENEVEEARLQTQDAIVQVAALIGTQNWQPVALGSLTVPDVEIDQHRLLAQLNQRSPAIQAALAEESASQFRAREARREAIPVPALSVGTVRDDQLRENVIGVSIAVPLFDRNKGGVASARAQAREALLNRMDITHTREMELKRAIYEWQTRKALLTRFEKHVLASLPRLQQMAEDAYRLGQNSILDMVDAVSLIAEKHNEHLDLLESTLLAGIDLRFAAGEPEYPGKAP